MIVNMCTDRIIYMVVTPDTALNIKNMVLIPYELATFQTVGTEDFLVINMNPSQLSGAPAFDPATASLDNPTWVTATNAFWSKIGTLSQPVDCSQRASISVLTSGTAQANYPAAGAVSTGQPGGVGTISGTTQPGGSATGAAAGVSSTAQATSIATSAGTSLPAATAGTGTATYNLAYARSINYTSIEDTAGTVLGAVNTILVRPETGTLLYFVMQPFQASNLKQKFLPVPAPAVTVSRSAGVSSNPASGAGTPMSSTAVATGSAAGTSSTASATAGVAATGSTGLTGAVVLVLQVPVQALQNAPAFDPKQDITAPGWDQSIIQYWSTNLPTTQP
jgi:hypothetical protein